MMGVAVFWMSITSGKGPVVSTFPATVVTLAVRACEPGTSVAEVMLHLPSGPATAVPRTVLSLSYSVTVPPAFAFPLTMGC